MTYPHTISECRITKTLPYESANESHFLFSNNLFHYAAVRVLPYYSKEFQKYQSQSPQKIRYQLGEKIRMNLIIHSLGQTIETIKKDLSLKKAFQELMRKCGYL